MDVFYLLILTIFYILLYIVYRFFMRNQKYWEKLGVPTVKSSVPYFGNVWSVLMQRKSFGELYYELYKSIPNSSMIGLYNCGENELMIKDPELIKTVLQTNFNSFEQNGFEFDTEMDPLLKRNPFVTTGEKWKNERLVLTNTMSASKLKNMSITIRQIGVKFSEYLSEKIDENRGVFETDAQILFARFTAEVVAGVGFGIDGQCFKKDTGTFVEMGGKLFNPSGLMAIKQFIIFVLPSLARVLRTSFLSKEFDTYCRRVIHDVLKIRKEKGTRGNDFIQHVVDLYKSESGEIDEDFVTCHATSFYIDGYLTSSHTLAYLAYDIARHPEVQNKLRAEVKEIIKKHQGELTYDAIQDMKYLDLVMKESMRVSSLLASMQKKCTQEFKLVGSDGVECVVKPGMKLILSPQGIHNDPKYWTNPEKFLPERFDDEHKNDFHKFAYLPFGGGARICPGMRMATLQMKYAIVTLLNNYSLTVSSRTKLPFTFDNVAILNIPQGGIWLNIKPL
nr:cytochrome P450 4AV17 [Meteorus pulchricornis]